MCKHAANVTDEKTQMKQKRYSYKQEVLSLQSLYCRRIHPGSVTKELLQWSQSAVVELPHLNFISTKKLTMTTNYISGTKGLWYEQSMVRIVHGPNSQWYERSMGRMVHGTNGLHVVRIVRGTNSQWYEKSRHRLVTAVCASFDENNVVSSCFRRNKKSGRSVCRFFVKHWWLGAGSLLGDLFFFRMVSTLLRCQITCCVQKCDILL